MDRFSVAKNALLRRLLALLLAAVLIIGSAAFAFAGDTLTTGADGSGESSEESSDGIDQETRERRVELYTIGAMITLGAMYLGIRDKRNRR